MLEEKLRKRQAELNRLEYLESKNNTDEAPTFHAPLESKFFSGNHLVAWGNFRCLEMGKLTDNFFSIISFVTMRSDDTVRLCRVVVISLTDWCETCANFNCLL